MISGLVYLLRIFKMFHGLMNNPVYYRLVMHRNTVNIKYKRESISSIAAAED